MNSGIYNSSERVTEGGYLRIIIDNAQGGEKKGGF